MHPAGPLDANDDTLQSGQKVERQGHAANRKNRGQHQRIRAKLGECHVQQRCHQMPDDQDCEVGRAIIGAVMVQILSAGRTVFIYFQVAREQGPLTTIGTRPAKAAPHRLLGIPFGRSCLGLRRRHVVPHAWRRSDPFEAKRGEAKTPPCQRAAAEDENLFCPRPTETQAAPVLGSSTGDEACRYRA